MISPKASIYGNVKIGKNVRIDDFCVLSGNITIGDNIHIATGTRLIGKAPIVLEDYAQLSFGISIFSSSDDFSGFGMVGPQVPLRYRKVESAPVTLKRHALIGCNSIVFPGVTIGEGAAVGALSVVKTNVTEWTICAGSPLRQIGQRSHKIEELEREWVNLQENFLDQWVPEWPL